MIDDHEYEPGPRGVCIHPVTAADENGVQMICAYKRKSHVLGGLTGWRRWLYDRVTASPLAWEYTDAKRKLDHNSIIEYATGVSQRDSEVFPALSKSVWEAAQHISTLRRVTIDGLVQYEMGYWQQMHEIASMRWKARRQAAKAEDSGPR